MSKYTVLTSDLLSDVTGTYDQTKTTRVGNIEVKFVNGKQVLGPALTKYSDVFGDIALAPVHGRITGNNRLFLVTAPVAGVGRIALYTVSKLTDGTFNVSTFVGSIAYTVPNAPATTHTVRSIEVQDTGTTGWRLVVLTVGTITANGGVFVVNNVALTDFAPVSFPTWPIAGVASTNTSKHVFFAQETGSHLLIAGAGMGYSNTSGFLYVQQGLVAAAVMYKFDLAATISSTDAAGITFNFFVLKTGTFTGLAGTILLLNCQNVSVPAHGSNSGSECYFIGTTTNGHLFKTSEITAAVTSFPSMTTTLLTGLVTDNIVQTPTHTRYSTSLDCILVFVNGKFYAKRFDTSAYSYAFGCTQTQILEGNLGKMIDFGCVAMSGFSQNAGTVVMIPSTVGQRAAILADVMSHTDLDNSYVVSKVFDTPDSQWKAYNLIDSIRGLSSGTKVFYRTSGFGVITGGWIALPDDKDMSAIVSSPQIQFKITYYINKNASAAYAQIEEAHFSFLSNNGMSENWEPQWKQTSDGIPGYVAFRLKKAYNTSVPQLFVRGYDTATPVANQTHSKNTTANAADFSYSTNTGSTWNPLGTIPNTVGTLVRLALASPPVIETRFSIRES
jgi:hypothetical protein